MRIKRVFFSCAACVLALSLLVPAASAHGGHHGRSGGCHGRRTQSQQVYVTVCTAEDCTIAGRHVHDGTVYCGYPHENGYCNGACAALCPVEGCTVAGRHVHDTVTYCGNEHSCGFCDSACSVPARRGCHH